MAAGGDVVLDRTACEVLKHPIRVRILEVLCEREISPIQFLHQGLLPPGVEFENNQNAVSAISYHFKVLMKAGCITLAGTKPRRGATEHIYRSSVPAFHSDEEWAAMTFKEREGISRATLQNLIARAEGAILAGTFDKRTDRHLSWLPMDLDEEGWAELRDLQAEALERAEQIKIATRERVRGRRELGEDAATFPATFGALAFESAPRTYARVKK